MLQQKWTVSLWEPCPSGAPVRSQAVRAVHCLIRLSPLMERWDEAGELGRMEAKGAAMPK